MNKKSLNLKAAQTVKIRKSDLFRRLSEYRTANLNYYYIIIYSRHFCPSFYYLLIIHVDFMNDLLKFQDFQFSSKNSIFFSQNWRKCSRIKFWVEDYRRTDDFPILIQIVSGVVFRALQLLFLHQNFLRPPKGIKMQKNGFRIFLPRITGALLKLEFLFL